MKIAAILLVSFGIAAAGAAVASDHLSDVDYLKANRCRGLAAGFGVGDTTSLDSLIKTEGRSRMEIIYQKGQEELARAKRDAARTDGRERLTAELNGPCVAFMGGKDTAMAGKDTGSAR